ncbi:solute carrier family 22 member 13-like [Cydia pomonella]|uniref:solute carrier family 22 member 13-like n=1 Tax=Cydia pomonella TaxID=82600 RepID=UPI002ADDE524|nr:solute carrier family 22 member 13-like [Cydia pomonella]
MDELIIETRNDNQESEKFKNKEPIVLVPIICLSLLQGISSTVDLNTILFARGKGDYSWKALEYYGILNTIGLIPGLLLVPFMIDVHGRKPAFTLLFFLSLLYFIINYFPYQQPLSVVGNLIVAIIKGGVRIITTLAICEYCGPKHRFAYLVADETVKNLSAKVTNILYTTGVFNVALPYVSSGAAVIALTCMVSVYWWPESPYWLASQGRVEQSRASLLSLRAESETLLSLSSCRNSLCHSSEVFFFGKINLNHFRQ